MYKILFCLALLISSLISQSQITITSEHMPKIGEKFIVSTSNIIFDETFNYELSGEDVFWDASSLIFLTQEEINFVSPTSSDIHFLCTAIFNNPFDQAHKATVAKTGGEMMEIPVEGFELSKIFELYKTTNQGYFLVGRTTILNQIPLCVKNEPIDTMFVFPLEYGKTFSSHSVFSISIPSMGYFGQEVSRKSEVDAFGTIQTTLGTYEVIRLKSEIEFVDSLSYEEMNIGMKIPRSEVHYIWLSTESSIPVLWVEEKGMMGGTVVHWIDTLNTQSVNEEIMNFVQVFPNPVAETLFIECHHSSCHDVVVAYIYDMFGKRFEFVVDLSNVSELDIRFLQEGIYKLHIPEINFSSTIVKLK